MKVDIQNLVPISEANQNFSKVARLVDKQGTAVILKNNKPKYVLVDYNALINANQEIAVAEDETVYQVASAVLSKHLDAFKELAK